MLSREKKRQRFINQKMEANSLISADPVTLLFGYMEFRTNALNCFLGMVRGFL